MFLFGGDRWVRPRFPMQDQVISGWDIYWITRLDGISDAAMPFIIVGFFGTMICYFWRLAASDEDYCGPKAPSKLLMRWLVLAFALGMAVDTFLPSTRQMCAIIAIPAIANAETTQEISTEIVTLAKEWLQELRPSD